MAAERRWLVLASDGRHVTVGRATDPSPEEIDAAADALGRQGLGGWLAVSEGAYFGDGPIRLMMVRPLVAPTSSWEEALAAFLKWRDAANRG